MNDILGRRPQPPPSPASRSPIKNPSFPPSLIRVIRFPPLPIRIMHKQCRHFGYEGGQGVPLQFGPPATQRPSEAEEHPCNCNPSIRAIPCLFWSTIAAAAAAPDLRRCIANFLRPSLLPPSSLPPFPATAAVKKPTNPIARLVQPPVEMHRPPSLPRSPFPPGTDGRTKW